jgi:cell division protein FtsN
MPESLRLSSLPSLRGQRGSTLTGLIIGLIIGLGIAVAVALVITKGSTPFTDKSGKGKLTEPTAGQVSDPNKPLYSSKEAARAANKELAAKAPAADADPLAKVIATISTEHPAAATGAAPVKAPAAVAAPAAAAKPETGTRADAVVKAAADAAAASGDDKFVYYLQAGAFREMADAETTRAKLALLGFEAAITDRTTDAGVLHRVRTGPYQQVDAMNKARAKLLDSGIDVAIVRNQK